MARRRRYDPLAPLTPRELRQQANLLLGASLTRPRQQIRRAQDESRRQTQEDAQMIQGFASAVAELLGPTGGKVDALYANAGERQQRIAQGYALGQQLAEQGAADQANTLLTQQGQTRRIEAGPASQVTYALGGANPSTYFNKAGSAFAAAAHGLPGMAAGRGQQLQAQRLSAGEKEQQKLREQLEDVLARGQASLPEILDRLYQREISKRATGIQQDYLGLSQGREAFDQSLDIAELNLAAQGAAGKQRGNANKNRLKARETRLSALASNKEKAFSFADELANRTKEVPGLGSQPDPPPYAEARAKLWNRYGQGLLRYAPPGQRKWWKGQIVAMIENALRTYGFKKPPKAKAPARRSGV